MTTSEVHLVHSVWISNIERSEVSDGGNHPAISRLSSKLYHILIFRYDLSPSILQVDLKWGTVSDNSWWHY